VTTAAAGGLLHGRRALVTGAGGGIGAAICARFAAEGAAVVAADRDGAAAAAAAAAVTAAGGTAHALTVDTTREPDVRAAVDEAARLLGGLDTVVANAGVLELDRADDVSADDLRRLLDVNVVGTFTTVRDALPHLRAAGGGVVVCTASQAGLEGAPELVAYCASKFAVVGLVESLARELAADGIRVCAIAPGLVDTPMLATFFRRRAEIRGETPETVAASVLAGVPLQRLAQPVEVANTVVFLASELASYLTGVTVPILGGELAG
jgi:NAD(P)-dependent dehydrogenase (short-subunit alcohol dehydrogenase family)